MQLEPFANLIVQAGLGVMGQSLFLHYMPPSIDSAIVILPSLAGSAISFEMPGWPQPGAPPCCGGQDWSGFGCEPHCWPPG